MELRDLIGQTILVLITRLHPTRYQKVKLLGVEAGGIWIESQDVTNAILQLFGAASAPTTLVLFFPYHEIGFVLNKLDVVSLDEKAFGV